MIAGHHGEVWSFIHFISTVLGSVLQTGDPKGKNNGDCSLKFSVWLGEHTYDG